MKTISVIIPVFNSIQFLNRLFECLDKNSFIEGDEVIFIDNGSDDGSYEACMSEAEKHPGLFKLYKYEEKASSYAARNYGIKKAKGDILAFTDSDCKPDADWMITIRENIEPGSVLGGRIILDVVEKDNVWEIFDTIAHLQSEKNMRANSIATANMVIYRDDFLDVGFFEERFSGGDYVWSNKAAEGGKKLVYAPDMIVHHPTRKTFRDILKKEQRIAYGDGNAMMKRGCSLCIIGIKYILKVCKVDTNLRYSIALYKKGIQSKGVWQFNICFFRIRFEQLKYAIKGYNAENVRKTGVK